MAVTANLSHRLHQTLGSEAGNEMVDWMTRMDAQRTELRELNELNFSRIAAGFGELEARLRAEFQAGQARTDSSVADLRRDMELGFARLEMKVEQRTADIMRWSFAFWVGSVLTITGALVALSRFLP